MGVHNYIISRTLLEEHRHNIARDMPDSDWPPSGCAETAPAMTAIRRWLGGMLRAVADRLDPSVARAQAVQLFVMPHPRDGEKSPRYPSAFLGEEPCR